MSTANGQKVVEEVVKERYVRNFLLLREKAPSIFQKITQRTDMDWSIKVSADGSLNAVIGGQELYPFDPKQIAKKQVEEFLQKPDRVINPYFPELDRSEKWIHNQFLFDIIGDFYSKPVDLMFKFDKEFIPLIVVFGMGFGYHVIELIRRFNVQHMIVVEPNPIFMNLSLYAIEWKEILDYFSRSRGKTFNTIVADEAELIKVQLRKIMSNINPAMSVHVFLFSHFQSPFFEEVVEFLKTENPTNPNLWGAIDSELSSLKHTVGNVKNKYPVYCRNRPVNENVPVILVGSGPSLDKLRDVLKENIDKALVVSCGTATKALYRMGIKPDIHTVADWQDINYSLLQDIDKRYMKDINIIGASFAHPKIFKLGRKAGLFLSAGKNVGDTFFPDYIPRIENATPTVTAASMSLLAHMGFRRFYLIGIDLGSRDRTLHHSKMSDYYKRGSPIYLSENNFNLEIEANFGGIAYTNYNLLKNKLAMEQTIKKNKLEVYNLSDGAKIEGSLPLHPEDFALGDKLTKDSLIREVFLNFRSSYLRDVNLKTGLRNMSEALNRFVSVASLKLRKGVKSIQELVELFSELHLSFIKICLEIRAKDECGAYIIAAQSLYKYEMFVLSASYSRPEDVEKITGRAFPVIVRYLKYVRDSVYEVLKSLEA
ncbi:motility associated factor glycosyltransferase family protein [Hydrogenivirga sp.]